MPRRCLVIGASGQLGQALSLLFQEAGHEVIQTYHQNPPSDSIRLDLGDPQGMTQLLQEIQPEWILIAGAFCNVDLCEKESRTCFQVNVEGPAAIAAWVRDQEGWVAYYSTDHVFDDSRRIQEETDPVHPLNLYAQSKVEGERGLRELLPQRHLILRTSWLYGPDPARRNFVLRLADQVSAGRQVQVPEDQWGSPTYTEDLARATLFLLGQGLCGTFHATGPDFLNRVSLAQRVCKQAGLDPQNVIPVPTSRLGQAARRPLRVRLDCRKLTAAGAEPFRGVDAGLAALWQSEASAHRK